MKRFGISLRVAWWPAMLLIWLAAGDVLYADQAAEDLAWSQANGWLLHSDWATAEKKFAEFMRNYPQSGNYAEAVLHQAEAISRQKRYAETIQLLTNQMARAGDQADKFDYRLALAYNSTQDFQSAADTFAALSRDCTNSIYQAEAMFREADAASQVKDLGRVVKVLQPPDSEFQKLTAAQPTNEWVERGLLLLGETALSRKDYPMAESALQELPSTPLPGELDWKRWYLICRLRIEGGHSDAALPAGTNLLAAAAVIPDLRTRAEATRRSIQMLGDIRRQLDQPEDAILTYQTNLSNDTPPEFQRAALLNIVNINLRLGRIDSAAARLKDFLARPGAEKGSDLELLIQGKIRLAQYCDALRQNTAAGPATAFLDQARTNFEQFISNYPSSAHLGQGYLDLGWCDLLTGRKAESTAAFSNAVAHLEFSEDKAVALFKLGDSQSQASNYLAAASNYSTIISQYGALPVVTNNLFEQSLYQLLRSDLNLSNQAGAEETLGKILDWFPNPNSGMWQSGLLLAGEDEKPAAARELFQKFLGEVPNFKLRPETELAIARTYEREGDWTNSRSALYNWIASNPNHEAMPEARFCLAWSEFKAGMDSNAFTDFTNFVASYPNHPRFAQAKYWLGSYYLTNDVQKAEQTFQEVPTNSPLYYYARLDAGLAAVDRRDFGDARDYFTKLFDDPKCPDEVRKQAALLCGDVYFSWSAASNHFEMALDWFHYFTNAYPNDTDSPKAIGRMGDTYRQMAAESTTNAQDYYGRASNSYQQVMLAWPQADIVCRSQAQYGMGLTLEGLARLKPNGSNERKALQQAAYTNFTAIVIGDNLHPGSGEKKDPFWVGTAGIEAGKLREEQGDWQGAVDAYQNLQKEDLPSLKSELEDRITKALKHLSGIP